MKSDQNLQAAFAGESQANRKYTAFSKKAQKEGFSQIAKLFQAAAEAETVHALNHLKIMKGVGSTLENLKAALEGEVYEHTKMYPEFIQSAESEKRSEAKGTFHFANEAEKMHAQLYKEAIEAFTSGRDLEKTDYFVCPVCGYTTKGDAPDKCPTCGALKNQFMRIT
ncbi:rubrerythrin family protein [[Eubacterium] cellulosolvens]